MGTNVTLIQVLTQNQNLNIDRSEDSHLYCQIVALKCFFYIYYIPVLRTRHPLTISASLVLTYFCILPYLTLNWTAKISLSTILGVSIARKDCAFVTNYYILFCACFLCSRLEYVFDCVSVLFLLESIVNFEARDTIQFVLVIFNVLNVLGHCLRCLFVLMTVHCMNHYFLCPQLRHVQFLHLLTAFVIGIVYKFKSIILLL